MNISSLVSSITRTISYSEYLQLVTEFAEQGKTSGEQLPEKISATALNSQRMHRIGKQCLLNTQLQTAAIAFSRRCKWLVIAETWCGDAAQCVPVISKIASLNPLIKLEIIFRDENPTIMDHFLTNGARAIPKLICIDEATQDILFIWGPRPKKIQQKVFEFKQAFPQASHDELVKNIHLWYARDKTASIQDEFIALLNN
jgi:hypothetical protein